MFTVYVSVADRIRNKLSSRSCQSFCSTLRCLTAWSYGLWSLTGNFVVKIVWPAELSVATYARFSDGWPQLFRWLRQAKPHFYDQRIILRLGGLCMYVAYIIFVVSGSKKERVSMHQLNMWYKRCSADKNTCIVRAQESISSILVWGSYCVGGSWENSSRKIALRHGCFVAWSRDALLSFLLHFTSTSAGGPKLVSSWLFSN